ncbi:MULTISPECIES: hypothetical protein [Bacillus cereus group]|uniref:hypothetical protein n=1 Tax=Bacillus cereus group TaxID=86661 RepID=UPI00065C064D|nr:MULTISPECIES: hypothetical protein [Bacillus cereus group]KMQ09131.1 hypothetical protein TU67_04970 [Bacillus cereus]PEB72740.1 hypothetical protein COM89_26300 [Bacillus thuringiensis]PFU61870.1 hypothetical protein COK85_09575 [Bacillus thuringiensis]PGM06347.1 hypothetical protein CN938_23575 [Bacillus thuringiensis]PGN39114.1 hypothetical protein CN968_18310 [Bacillus thuringiensis]
MRKGCRERYLKQITAVITTKRKYPTGYLVVGEYRLSLEIQKDILDILDHSEVTSSHIDFNNYKDEDECLIVMKKAKKQLSEDRQSGKLLILVITNFDRFNAKKMDAVKQLISCQAIGINLLVSANVPLVHLVGLTEYMITVDSTAKVLSKFYRYNTQQVIYSLHNESLV